MNDGNLRIAELQPKNDHPAIFSHIGKQIRALRLAKRTTLDALSVKLHISTATLIRYEKGERQPDGMVLQWLLVVFPDTSPDWLLTGQGEMLRGSAKPDTHGTMEERMAVVESHLGIDGIYSRSKARRAK